MGQTIRLYYDDPYLETFEAHIVDRTFSGESIRYALDRTAFYPEGGGQPCDTGTLNSARVTSVQSEDGVVWHEVDEQIDADVVQGVIDWPRRFDHMQQHHGQHLLSAAFENLFSIPTTSFHLGRTNVTIDLGMPTISDAHLRQAEQLANEVIWDNRPINAQFVTADELKTLPLRKPPVVTENIRVVSVPGYDHSACGGTHPASTGAVGTIVILRTERRGEEMRVEFACGGRVLDHFHASHDRIQKLARELTVGPEELAETVLRLRDAEVGSRKELAKARQSLIAFEAEGLLSDARNESGMAVVSRCFAERPGNELQGLARALSTRGAFAILGAAGSPAQVVIARPETYPFDCGIVLRDVLERKGGRGGGRPDVARGGLPNDQLEAAIESLGASVVEAIKSSNR